MDDGQCLAFASGALVGFGMSVLYHKNLSVTCFLGTVACMTVSIINVLAHAELSEGADAFTLTIGPLQISSTLDIDDYQPPVHDIEHVSFESKFFEAGDEAKECPICLEEFQAGDIVTVLPNCTHLFHPQCIYSWCVHSTKCPVCRAVMYEERDA